ncbi:ABC transporter permease [Thermosulfurimonas dismutans]|uniref:Putative ABC transporter for tryptophane, permease protein TrpY n=1 Tax=Thermosulfurimonas dismutans TaxID=999894 RepID=A0A179D3J0_9BACT|nr:hypothetical protein [Thermosulfurimonas dismutans]OAQ20627.1 putative ABC transporter for tryptophane, permease protein TrpY [Thermosulfurimonas dismutans]
MNWLIPLDIGLIMGLIFSWVVLSLAIAFRLFNFPDLTIEGSFLLGAAVYATLYKANFNICLSIFVASIAGGLSGFLTALLHSRFKLNKFLAAIIVIAIIYSLSLRLMGASNISLLKTKTLLDYLNRYLYCGFHVGIIGFLFLFVVFGLIFISHLLSTKFGLRLRVSGSNPEYARSLGINVSISLIIGLFFTNCLAAFSGILLAMYQGFVDVGMGQGTLILALAAMTIGERVLPESCFSFHNFVCLSAVVGSILYQLLVAYAVRFGLAPTDLKLVTALLVLMVVILRVSRDSELFADM